MSVHLFGIRHHGPGCARSLRVALAALAPDIVLVEGPPDAQAILSLLTHTEMRPPVAMLLYDPAAPHHAVYYPFTDFSPEWQALRFALTAGIPARFTDLPQAIQLARVPADVAAEDKPAPESELEPAAAAAAVPTTPAAQPGPPDQADLPEQPALRDDPIGMLAEAAGYTDHELWWEQQIEQRVDATNLFEGILEAMSALRAGAGPAQGEEAQREAHMRQAIRAAQAEGFARIAVVCGAWHAPALTQLDDAAADTALLANLPRTEVAVTWIPWTNSRLSYRTGYGAGIASPGWYAHLWSSSDRGAIRWLAHVAALLREQDLEASSASVIEAVRLGEALAALRGLPMPGLSELNEATLTVLCHGDPAPMHLIHEQMEIGEAMGAVPSETPAVPLQRDLEALQRRLKLVPSAGKTDLDLDLRQEIGRARSQLLHRLRLLDIPWGTPQRVAGNKLGTFHELWQLEWQVEFAVKLIEANVWGNTIASAATAYVRHAADEQRELPALTSLLDGVILAELPQAAEHLLDRINTVAAVSADVRHLMDALPPLAQIARYSDVRETRSERIAPVIDALFARVIVGLPGASGALDDEAARALVASIDNVQASLEKLNRADLNATWYTLLGQLAQRDGTHSMVRGRASRLLLEYHIIDEAELQRQARLALAPVVPASEAAAWVEGLLHGSGLLLQQQDGLWVALDAWLRELPAETFVALLPLLRRTFSSFPAPQRRQMGQKVRRLGAATDGDGAGMTSDADRDALAALDRGRADSVLPVLAHILGVSDERG